MEKYEIPKSRTDRGEPERARDLDLDLLPRVDTVPTAEGVDVKMWLAQRSREREQKAKRRKWLGSGLMGFGLVSMLASCPVVAVSVFRPEALLFLFAPVGLIAAGLVLVLLKPKLKSTNEALFIAAKHGYRLTAARLAVEMDVSFEKAEKIIKELVRQGLAEIDLDHQDPDHSITYRIRGL